jgi:chorismate dehydratase
VGAVSYLNTRPLLYGIQRHHVASDIELIIDYPSRIATLLLNNSIDVGLVPVSIIPQLADHRIETDFCIGSDVSVASVCLFSDLSMQNLDSILLDYQSRTSVQLIRLLAAKYWSIQPEWIDAREDYRARIGGRTGGLMIGDRALEQRKISAFHYDLGEAWKVWTGLPFVFAAWISNKPLPDSFLASFNEANAWGIQHVDDLLESIAFDAYDLREYFHSRISYTLDEAKRKGLRLFLDMIGPQ